MPHTIVVLGAGYSGVPLAHHLLKHTPASVGLRVILVAPNEAMYFHNASVRGILPDGQLPDEKLFFPLAKAFSVYGKDKFELVLGRAQSMDPASNSVTVALNAGGERAVRYDTLVIATGSSFKGLMPFKNLDGGSTADTKAALQAFRDRLKTARTVVVAGAGQTGVEVAGELGSEYASKGLKEVTLIADDHLPLGPEAKNDVRQAAARELGKMRVRVIANTRVTAVSGPKGEGAAIQDGPKQLTLTSKDGKVTTLEADAYIPTFGVVANTSFAPPELLDATGRFRTTRTFQVEGHPNIFALGDAANLQTPSGKHADDQLIALAPRLQDYLAGRPIEEWKPDDTVIFAVSLGRKGGTGQMGSFKIWSFLVWFLKARHLGTNYAQEFVDGKRTIQASKW